MNELTKKIVEVKNNVQVCWDKVEYLLENSEDATDAWEETVFVFDELVDLMELKIYLSEERLSNGTKG